MLILIIIRFECGTYYGLTKDNPTLCENKINKILEDARKNFCDHDILEVNRIRFPKFIVKDQRKLLDQTYFLYRGCCTFGN